MLTKIKNRLKRKIRTKSKIVANSDRPRLSFYKSNKHLFVQIIDDMKSVTLVSASDLEVNKKDLPKDSKGNMDLYFKVGELVAAKAVKKNIKLVVLDRGGFKFHGLLSKFSEGARKGGLEF